MGVIGAACYHDFSDETCAAVLASCVGERVLIITKARRGESLTEMAALVASNTVVVRSCDDRPVLNRMDPDKIVISIDEVPWQHLQDMVRADVVVLICPDKDLVSKTRFAEKVGAKKLVVVSDKPGDDTVMGFNFERIGTAEIHNLGIKGA